MSGWYKMHRGWMDDALFDSDPFCKRAAWEYLIHEAAYDDHDQWFNGQPITVRRGQFVVSERRLSATWKWDRQRVRTFLRQLERDGKLTRELTHGVTLLNIRNYERFQGGEPSDQPTNKPRANPELTQLKPTTEEGKERKEGKEEKKGRWTPPDWIDVEAWKNWETYRREIKKPLTDRARAGCVKVLEQARDAGFPVKQVIDASIDRGWTGLFVPKGEAPPKYPTPPGFKSRKDWIASRIEMLKSLMEHGDREKYIEEFRALRKERDAQWT